MMNKIPKIKPKAIIRGSNIKKQIIAPAKLQIWFSLHMKIKGPNIIAKANIIMDKAKYNPVNNTKIRGKRIISKIP